METLLEHLPFLVCQIWVLPLLALVQELSQKHEYLLDLHDVVLRELNLLLVKLQGLLLSLEAHLVFKILKLSLRFQVGQLLLVRIRLLKLAGRLALPLLRRLASPALLHFTTAPITHILSAL